ncbi:MAG: hypothetical protein M0042_08930 [Nitrospiraceae bacterium]|nr:hypothetical protein [Nitrospiraceae bacterium]
MILHPGMLALLAASLIIAAMALGGAGLGYQILRRWDPTSGSELQLILERRTTLVSTLLAWAFGLEFLSLFLFAGVADSLHSQFVGAMCAAGVLNASATGYPLLILKMANVLLAGSWLIVNHADTRATDYPLIRAKYVTLLVAAPLLIAEAVLLVLFAGALKPHVITSCCGSLFSSQTETMVGEMAPFPFRPMAIVFLVSLGAVLAAGWHTWKTAKGGILLALLSFAAFIVVLASILSWVGPYVYELPTHHCPFCLLQREYHFIGYPLYGLLFAATVSGMGAGILVPAKRKPSLKMIVPGLQRSCAAASVVLYGLLFLLIAALVATSNLKLL